MSESTTLDGLVLIVDDNPEARRMLEVRVKREGHRTLVVENGRQALDALAREAVDVILLDIEMPELNGYGVLAALRADPQLSHIPVLIISGGGDQDDLVRCIEMGAVDYLPKPFNQAVLRARISACLVQKRERDRERIGGVGVKTMVPPGAVTMRAGATWAMGARRPDDSAQLEISPNAVPSRLGRILLGRLLGTGAMGEVYLGHHELLDLPVAIKLMRPELVALPDARERLLREARMAVRLAHRNIVRLLEVGETDYGVHLVFEYISGGTLADMLNREPDRRLSIPTTIRVLTEVASALVEAEKLGIIHRDIKPANLLMTPEGEVRIGDFGLAKQEVAMAATGSNITVEGVVVGTPLYMAPEQIMLGTRLDTRTDLYALGSVLYEMLVGHAPFGEPPNSPTRVGNSPSSTKSLFHNLRHTAPTPPKQLRPDTPEWLESVCLTLLAKSPDDRFPTPEHLLTAIMAGSHLQSASDTKS